MFETRVHLISENDALNKRKLWEGFLQWANRFSGLDSDNIARNQFSNPHFFSKAFIEQTSAGFSSTGVEKGRVSNDTGTLIALSASIESLDVSGEYWITWNVEAKTKNACFAGGVPFIGDRMAGAAQDFKALVGWFNNSVARGATAHGPSVTGFNTDEDPYEAAFENWMEYKKKGGMRNIAHESVSKTPVGLGESTTYWINKPFIANYVYYHLSGCGSVHLPRCTGNVGVVLYTEPGADLNVLQATMVLRKRNR